MKNDNAADVAVIMSVYKSDSPEWLVSAFESLLGQKVVLDIYVNVDGPVGPELDECLERYDTEAFRCCVYRNPVNQGLPNSLNRLLDTIDFANYKFIARMDSDDISFDNRFEKQVAFLELNPDVEVLGGGCLEFSKDISSIDCTKLMPASHSEILAWTCRRNPMVHPSVMFRSEVIARYRYSEDAHLTEDYDLWIRMLRDGVVFANLPEPVLYFRFSEGTLQRRQGFGKAWRDLALRWRAMRELRGVSPSNILFAAAIFTLRVMPSAVSRFAYRHFRS